MALRRHSLTVAIIPLTTLGFAKEPGKTPTELDGAWVVASVTRDPKEENKDEGKGLRVEIAGTDVLAKDASGKVLGEATIAVDSTTKPKSIDVNVDGKMKRVLGIYRLKEDILTICIAPLEAERPSKFEAKPGSKQTMIVLKRLKRDSK